MPSLEFHPLSELRGEAAALLSARFAAQRAAEPLLPETEDFSVQVPLHGLVATRGGEAVAYLAGEVDGDTARVGFAGCAASQPEALRGLFAILAEQWNVSRFAVAVPASAAGLIDAFFRLAFGCQFVWAVRDTDRLHHEYLYTTPQVRIRNGNPDDLEAVSGLDELLWRLQARSPSFSGLEVPARGTFREDWADTWADRETFPHFVAERDGRVVGHALLYRRPEGDLRVPAGNIDLAHAATRDEVRGTGVGLALTAYVLDWAREHGYRSMTTDWRSVNLLSSRFWPARGFRPQYLRLYRAVP